MKILIGANVPNGREDLTIVVAHIVGGGPGKSVAEWGLCSWTTIKRVLVFPLRRLPMPEISLESANRRLGA